MHPPDICFRDFEKVLLKARPTVSKGDLTVPPPGATTPHAAITALREFSPPHSLCQALSCVLNYFAGEHSCGPALDQVTVIVDIGEASEKLAFEIDWHSMRSRAICWLTNAIARVSWSNGRLYATAQIFEKYANEFGEEA